MFIAAGYAAAAAERARPRSSLPCATCAWPSSPWVHLAPSSWLTCALSPREKARVVYFRAVAPNAHWAS
eukprot:219274-Pleurochrysis_carterae.AAC.1